MRSTATASTSKVTGRCAASCHVGRGQRPDEAGNDLENIDCLMCHNDDYAAQRTRLPDGSMGVAQPDDGMVRNVHRPTRANCLTCHATAGGGDGVKRGDLSMATITNADRSFDVHMNSAGSNLECQSCHVFNNHKVIGKGSDLRPTDDLARGSEISCLTCHTDKNSPSGHDTAKVNDHVARVACQTCHIPVVCQRWPRKPIGTGAPIMTTARPTPRLSPVTHTRKR